MMPGINSETIGDRISDLGRNNHFTTIRAIAATMVVLSHGYIVANSDWAVADYGYVLGFTVANHAVHAFFFLSGFLLTMSFVKNPNALTFMIARVLRLTPAIFVSALVLALVMGPLVTTLEPLIYFNPSELATFFVSIVTLWDIQYGLPGVFAANPEPHDLYELLWTLRYEYLFCIGLLAAGWVGALRDRRIALAGAVLFSLAYVMFYAVPSINDSFGYLHHGMRFTMPFAFGAVAYLYREKLPYSLGLGAVFAIAAILSEGSILAPIIGTLALSYFILLVGCSRSKWLKPTTWMGQFSYGVYIYGFPIQQLLMHLKPDLSPIENGVASLLVLFPMAILSWYVIEKPVLGWRHAIAGAITNLVKAPEQVTAYEPQTGPTNG